MFKKFKKRRLSLKIKTKSTSLKDINVVQNFVHQTAKIMSASAESLVMENSSGNLVTILDQSFQTNQKCSTAPPSSFASPDFNKKPYCQSMIINSTNSDLKKDVESSSTNFVSNECNLNMESEDIDVIVEENSLSEMVTSIVIVNTIERPNYFDIFASPKKSISKQSLKRCYSFSDINIKNIGAFNKKHGSIETFITVSATLSTEFDNQPTQLQPNGCNHIPTGKNHICSGNPISNKYRIVKNQNYRLKNQIKKYIQRIWFKPNPFKSCLDKFNQLHRQLLVEKMITANSDFNLNYKDLSINNQSMDIIKLQFLKYLNYKTISNSGEQIPRNLNKTNHKNWQLVLDENNPTDIVPMNPDKLLPETTRKYRIFKGDDKSEIIEIQIEKEPNTLEYEHFTFQKDQKSRYEVIKTFMGHPLFITGSVITGMIILVPTINKISQWLPTKFPLKLSLTAPLQIADPPPNLEPISPAILFSDNVLVNEMDNESIIANTNILKPYIFIPNIIERLSRITNFIYEAFKTNNY